MEYKCDICNKIFASRQSRWNHNKRLHRENVIQDVVLNSETVVLNGETVVQDVVNDTNNNDVDNRTCKYCKKKLCDRKYRWKHEKKCKSKIINKNNVDCKDIKINKMEEEIKELRSIIQQSLKIHPKQLNKINNQLNQQNNINNNNNYIQLGREDFNNVLNNNEKLAILEKKGRSLTKFIETIYQNDKFKKFQNIYITN